MLIFYHETTFFPRWCKIAHPQCTDYFDYWELEVGCRLSEDPEVGWVVLADLAVVVVAGGVVGATPTNQTVPAAVYPLCATFF